MFMAASFFRHRIISTASPGVTAYNALYGEPAANNKAPFLQGLNGILRTGWGVAACRWKYRGNGYLVKPY